MQKTEKFQFCNYADLFLFCNARLRTMLQNEKLTAQSAGEFVIFLINRLSTKPLAAECQRQVERRATQVNQRQGLKTSNPRPSKFLAFRVTMCKPCTKAVAASKLSIAGKGLPAAATNCPQRSATCSSMLNTWSKKNRDSSFLQPIGKRPFPSVILHTVNAFAQLPQREHTQIK